MTEQEFLEIVSLHCETWFKYDVYANPRSRTTRDVVFFGMKLRKGNLLKEINLDDYILVKWVSGGVSGGSCWGDDPSDHHSMAGEPEPDFTDLDIILEKVVPNLTYRDYKKMIQSKPELIEYDSQVQGEYYGNETRYGIKKIMLRRLWEKLKVYGNI